MEISSTELLIGSRLDFTEKYFYWVFFTNLIYVSLQQINKNTHYVWLKYILYVFGENLQ